MVRTSYRPALTLNRISKIRVAMPRAAVCKEQGQAQSHRHRLAEIAGLERLSKPIQERLTLALDKAAGPGTRPPAHQIPEHLRNESVTAFHSSSGRHIPNDVRGIAGGDRGLPATAGFGVAGGGLSNDSGDDVLSGRGPDGDGIVGNGSTGAAVRAGAGAESDDVFEFARQLDHHAAVYAGPEHRYCRA